VSLIFCTEGFVMLHFAVGPSRDVGMCVCVAGLCLDSEISLAVLTTRNSQFKV
jgi:hypothetical protein